ncbi:3',5'-cyclic-nucleotide phosphodiesterase [soil metagenome]
MKIQLLPSTINEYGASTLGQHLTCFVVDDCVAIDAGSLAFSATVTHRQRVRDVVLTHAHLDHIAGLPLFIDDLFATLKTPVRIHASQHVIDILERDIFNWSVYPRFSELKNDHGAVMEYRPFKPGNDISICHLTVTPVEVNHLVPSAGFIFSDGITKIALSGDTAEMDIVWESVNELKDLSALFVECAFPESMQGLAEVSHHLTPSRLAAELEKFGVERCPVYAINLKPMYREEIIEELAQIRQREIKILEVGCVSEF